MPTTSERADAAELADRLVRWRPGLLAGALAGAAITSALFVSWGYQLANDIGVAGITRPNFWGLYIINFVFWIGISHAGTLISAILRVTSAEWRRPVTRCAEAITVFAISIGGLFPLIHLGRSWLFFWMFPYPNHRGLWPNFRSPLLWDVTAITTYLTGSSLYLLLPLIPDLAILRDRTRGFRHRVYRLLALGWRGTPQQWHSLEAGIRVLAVVIIPVAVSVHTIVSWDFAMSVTPMWHSTIFGPYFVVGAIYSGIAILMVAMALLRRGLRLERYLDDRVFDYLGLLFVVMALLWTYFTVAEHITVWYGNEAAEMVVFRDRVAGRFAVPFWSMIALNTVIPLAVLPFRRGRTPAGTAAVGVAVLIGMWLERYLIVVPSLANPRLPYTVGTYHPTWVEIGITIGAAGMLLLLYFAFTQLVPIVSIWEVREGERRASRPGEGAAPAEASPSAVRFAPHLVGAGRTLRRVRVACDDTAALRALAARLARAGISAGDVEIRSSVPLDDLGPHLGPLAPSPGRSRAVAAAMTGGVFGGATALAIAAGSALAYPIVTGGMPIVAPFPVGVITFEGTALGAILATVATVLLEARIAGRRPRPGPFDRELSDGAIVVEMTVVPGPNAPPLETVFGDAVRIATT